METFVEHRKHPRYFVHFKGIFSIDGKHLEECVVLDLSLGGCRLMSTVHIPFETPVELDIRPDQPTSIYIPSAVVRWTGEFVFGLEFIELPELESAALTRLLWTLHR